MSQSNTRPSCPAAHVPAAVNGDLRLVSSTPLRTSGGSTFPSKAIGKPLQACSPISHRRFSINATEYAKYTLLVYTSDIQNPTGIDQELPNINEVPSRVDYHSLVDFLFVQPGGIPLLPFQRRLHAAPHYRVTRRTRWPKSKLTSPKTRNESPTMSVPPVSPSRETSSRTVPRPSPYSYDVAGQRWRAAISINFKPLWKEPELYRGG